MLTLSGLPWNATYYSITLQIASDCLFILLFPASLMEGHHGEKEGAKAICIVGLTIALPQAWMDISMHK